MEPPRDGGTKVCSNDPGHMTKMAAMPIYSKNLKKSSSQVHKYYQVCSNDDAGLTLTYFTARSNLVPYAFVCENGKTMDISETIVVYVKVGRCI